MKFLISVISDSTELASADEMTAIDAYNDGLRANGHWIFAWGLEGPEASLVIDNRAGAGIVQHGPLHDLPEHIAGFWLIEAVDQATAQALAAEGSRACNRKVELRKLHG